MATTELTGALGRADRQGMTLADRLAHEASSYVRVSDEIRRVVVRFKIAAAAVDRLSAMDSRDMSAAQFDHLADAQRRMAEARAVLAAAGQLHLIEVA